MASNLEPHTGAAAQDARRPTAFHRLLERLRHLRDRWRLARSGLFDAQWYATTYADQGVGGDPLGHFMRKGAAAGLKPNPLFDPRWYCGRYPDVGRGGRNPLLHYIVSGAAESRNPSPRFSSDWYRSAYADVAGSGVNPLAHYLRSGQAQGRLPRAPEPATVSTGPVLEPPITVLKPGGDLTGREVALVLAAVPEDGPDARAARLCGELRQKGLSVVLLLVGDLPGEAIDPTGLAGLYAWGGRCSRIAAWSDLLRIEPGLFDAGLLLLMDARAPDLPAGRGLAEVLASIRAAPADLIALADSHDPAWRLRTGVLALKPKALARPAFQSFWLNVGDGDAGPADVAASEVGLTAQAIDAGLSCEVLSRTPWTPADASGEHPQSPDDLLMEAAPEPAEDTPVVVWRLRADLTAPAGDPLAAVSSIGAAWIVLVPDGAELHPRLTAILHAEAQRTPNVDIFYGDDSASGDLNLKPAFNPALLAAQDYVVAPLIVRGAALQRLGGLHTEAGSGVLYDLLLRAAAAGLSIGAIRDTLASYRGLRPAPMLSDRRRVLEQAVAAADPGVDVIAGLTPGTLRVRRRFTGHPAVTLVIPTRRSSGAVPGGAAYIERLLESLAVSTWPADRLRVLVGDDVEGAARYAERSWPFELRRIATSREPAEPFNYAAKMNRLWREAGTEHLVLMNDDLEVQSRDWLEALMTFAVQEDVGGVGARLLLPDGRLQHAGMIGGPFGLFVHAWEGQTASAPTYGDWALMQRDWSAVTGAVFATRKSALERVGGFDERFSLEYNDVDLCLRLGAAGLRIVYAPDAVFVHHERASRRDAAPRASETALFLRRWRAVIADDPMGHPGLARDRFDLAPAVDAS